MGKKYKKLTDYLSALNNKPHGKWIIDRENVGTMERPIQMPFVSYDDLVVKLFDDIYEFSDLHPEYKLNEYQQILEEHGLKWEIESMINADVSQMDGNIIMAMLMGTVRAEKFCEGVFLEFLQNGTITKWLERLREIDYKEGK